MILFVAAIMVTINWFVFIFAVQMGFVLEASLGDYIFPLPSVLIGHAIFSGLPRPAQWGAVALAILGVTVLAVGLGAASWVSPVPALSSVIYGALERGIDAPAQVSVLVEVLSLLPVAICWMACRGGAGLEGGAAQVALLAATEPMTAVPLIFFTMAARRIASATLGILSYLNLTLQFLCGGVWLSEPFTRAHRWVFLLIWAAALLYSWTLWRDRTPSRNTRMAASASSTT